MSHPPQRATLVKSGRTDHYLNQAIANLADHHIVAVRRRKSGEITQIKHVAFGWMTVADFYRLQKVHDAVPFLIEIIKGGYMMKAALWTVSVPLDILGSGTNVPLGVFFVTAAIAAYLLASQAMTTKVITIPRDGCYNNQGRLQTAQDPYQGPTYCVPGYYWQTAGSQIIMVVPDTQTRSWAWLYIAALFLPFGEIFLAYEIAITVWEDFASFFQSLLSPTPTKTQVGGGYYFGNAAQYWKELVGIFTQFGKPV